MLFLIAFNVDFDQFGKYTGTSISIFGAAMALFTVTIWAYSSKGESYKEVTSEDDECNPPSKIIKVLQDTHFVTAWVVASFMLFEILVNIAGLDLKKLVCTLCLFSATYCCSDWFFYQVVVRK